MEAMTAQMLKMETKLKDNAAASQDTKVLLVQALDTQDEIKDMKAKELM